MKEKYKLKISNFLRELESQMHSDLFVEEYTNYYDSNSESQNRENGINPMNQEYILKIAIKRKEMGVSKIGSNGLPIDNSSELYIKKIIFNYLSQKIEEQNFETKPKMNISSFFKKQKIK